MSLYQKLKDQSLPKRVFIALLVFLILFLLLLGVALIILSKNESKTLTTTPQTTQVPLADPTKSFEESINPLSVQEAIVTQDREKDIKIIAEPFLERFGSYNNQDNFKNIQEIKSYMSASLLDWVENSYLDQLSKSMPDISEFYAINTKVLSSEVIMIDDATGRAQILMNTQREEVGGISGVKYQDARVELQKIDSQWKVTGVYWL